MVSIFELTSLIFSRPENKGLFSRMASFRLLTTYSPAVLGSWMEVKEGWGGVGRTKRICSHFVSTSVAALGGGEVDQGWLSVHV